MRGHIGRAIELDVASWRECLPILGRYTPLDHACQAAIPEQARPDQGLRRLSVCDKDDPAPPGAVRLPPPAGEQPGNLSGIGPHPHMNTGGRRPVNGGAQVSFPRPARSAREP